MNNLNLKKFHFFKITLCFVLGFCLVKGNSINTQLENKETSLKEMENVVEESPSQGNIHYLKYQEQQRESNDDEETDDKQEKLSLILANKVYNEVLDTLKKGSYQIEEEKPQAEKIKSLKRLINYKLRRDKEHVEEKLKSKKPSRNEHRHIFIGRSIGDDQE